MTPLMLLLYAALFPLLFLIIAMRGREKQRLMLGVLAAGSLLFGVLAWVLFFAIRANSASLATDPSLASIDHTAENLFATLAGGLTALAWVLGLFIAVQERATRWILLITLGSIVGGLAKVLYDYRDLFFSTSYRAHAPEILWIGLFALSLLGGLVTLVYSTRGPTRGQPIGMPIVSAAMTDPTNSPWQL